jgi:hypothetical protein
MSSIVKQGLALCLAGLAFAGLTARASAQCVTTTSSSAGVKVTVTATLHTSDPNENGEGEPLVITSSDGSLNATVPSYEVPYSFTFKATQPNVSVSGTIVGFDGDESCELGASAKRFSDATKDSLNKIAAGLATTSGALWTYDALCSAGIISAPFCNAIIGVGAASTSLLTGIAATLLAIDPTDPNYMQLPVPIAAAYTSISASGNISARQAAAANALLANEALAMGYMRAMIQAINRASTAEAAGDAVWPARQLQALASFQAALGPLLGADAALRQDWVNALVADGVGPVTIPASQVLQLEAQVAAGWTPRQLQLLQSFGLGADVVELARRVTFVQDINQVAGTYPAGFARADLLNALRSASSAFQGLKLAIKPGSDPAPVNVDSGGVIPVAVLGSSAFDVRSIDVQSARFGPNGAPQSFVASFEDANGDGVLDLVFHIDTAASGINCGDTMAVMTAKTADGDPLVGSGRIKTVGCR